MPSATRTASVIACAVVFVSAIGLAPATAAAPRAALGVAENTSIVATADGYRFMAGPGQNNDIIVTADDDNVLFIDKSLTSFGAMADGCSPAKVAEGVGVQCVRLPTTQVLGFVLGDGDDALDGGTGEEYPWLPADLAMHVQGGSGDNLVLAGDGDDRIVGGDGLDDNDTLYGGPGDDVVLGGKGNNYVRGHAGDDLLVGGNGIDFIIGDGGNDVMRGLGSVDYLYANQGDDVLRGGVGPDGVFGGLGADRVSGDAGNDTVDGEVGRDVLSGGTGDDDVVSRDQMADLLDCGKGADTAKVDAGKRDRIRADCERVRRPTD